MMYLTLLFRVYFISCYGKGEHFAQTVLGGGGIVVLLKDLLQNTDCRKSQVTGKMFIITRSTQGIK